MTMISVIIPVYNEARTIKKVIEAIEQSDLVDEIIVVNDGSTDKSKEEIEKTNASLLDLEKNSGKGRAMMEGIKKSKGEILLFLDGDLVGLNPNHINDLLIPVLNGRVEMTIGIFKNNPVHESLYYISGQRAVTRAFLKTVPDFAESGYGVEILITETAIKNNISFKKVSLKGISHTLKSAKYNMEDGILLEAKAIKDIFGSGIEIPKEIIVTYYNKQQNKVKKFHQSIHDLHYTFMNQINLTSASIKDIIDSNTRNLKILFLTHYSKQQEKLMELNHSIKALKYTLTRDIDPKNLKISKTIESSTKVYQEIIVVILDSYNKQQEKLNRFFNEIDRKE